MKVLTTLCSLFFCALTASAAPAVAAPLSTYLALGPGGVTIGTTRFSDFTLEPLQTGATQIPTSILVTPINLFGAPTLQFSPTQVALPGDLFELKLSYTVQDISILGASVTLGAALASGDGSVTGTLDLTGPVPAAPTLIAFATSPVTGVSDATSFPSVAQVRAQTSIVLDGGGSGRGSVGTVSQQFSVVPEPGTALFGLALSGFCAATRRRQPRPHRQ